MSGKHKTWWARQSAVLSGGTYSPTDGFNILQMKTVISYASPKWTCRPNTHTHACVFVKQFRVFWKGDDVWYVGDTVHGLQTYCPETSYRLISLLVFSNQFNGQDLESIPGTLGKRQEYIPYSCRWSLNCMLIFAFLGKNESLGCVPWGRCLDRYIDLTYLWICVWAV